jgi:hypothetical protein
MSKNKIKTIRLSEEEDFKIKLIAEILRKNQSEILRDAVTYFLDIYASELKPLLKDYPKYLEYIEAREYINALSE